MVNHEPTLRVIRILDTISYYSELGLTLKNLIDKTKMPKSTVFNIVSTLVDQGVVEEVDSNVKKYKLGLMAYIVASRYLEKLDILVVANDILKDLSDVTGLTSFVGKIDVQNVYYVFKYEPKGAYKTNASVNSTNYLHSTSLGKAYLITLNKKELNEVVKKMDFIRFTDSTITDSNELIKELDKSRKLGYTIDSNETQTGLICYGAPVYDHNGDFVASISISGKLADEEANPLYGKLVKQAADKITALLNK